MTFTIICRHDIDRRRTYIPGEEATLMVVAFSVS